MSGFRGKIRKLVIACMGIAVFSTVGMAAPRLLHLEIPAQPLSAALNELARQSGVQIIYFSEILSNVGAPALKGEFTFEEALSILLKSTDLKFKALEDGFVFIEEGRKPEKGNVAAVPPVRATLPHTHGEMESVIVTARRREEDMMNVPFSIDALNRVDMAERNIENLLQANGQFRNVWIRTDPFSGAAGLEIGMRGINRAVLYQDGVPIRFGALPSTLDIERIEVMRGPQGTLFGPSAVGGAIQMVTTRAVQSFFGTVEITGGSFDRHDLGVKLNLPLNDELATSVTAATLNRDGFVRSVVTGQDLGSRHDRFLRLDSLWKPGADTEVRFQYARTLNRSNGQAYVNFRLDAVCPEDPVPEGYRNSDGEQIFFAPNSYCILSRLDLDPDTPGLQPYTSEFHSYGRREVYANTIRSQDMRWWQQISDAKLDWEMRVSGQSSFRAIVSRRWGSENSAEDLDGTGLDIFQNNHNQLQELWDLRTAELQYFYGSRRLSGIVGIYRERSPGALQKRLSWVHNELTIPEIRDAAEAAYPDSTNFAVQPESAPFNTAQFFRISKLSSTQSAVFTEWSWAASDKLKLSAGVRFTRQENERVRYRPGAAGAVYLPPVRCCDLDPSVNYLEPAGPAERIRLPVYTQWTPRLSIQYDWQPDLMAYLNYAKGGRAGGVDVNPPPGSENDVYRPETIHTVETGVRVRTPTGRTQLHVAGFHSDYDDVQVSEEIFPGTLKTGNAQARMYGLELEGTTLFESWRFNYGIGWLDARYIGTGTTSNLQESSRFAYAPELNLSAGITYEQRWSRYGLLARVDYTWQAETITSTDPLLAQPVASRGLLGGRLELRPLDGPWYVALSGTNLTREFFFTSGFLLPADQSFAGTMGRPNEWALTLGMRFD